MPGRFARSLPENLSKASWEARRIAQPLHDLPGTENRPEPLPSPWDRRRAAARRQKPSLILANLVLSSALICAGRAAALVERLENDRTTPVGWAVVDKLQGVKAGNRQA